VLRNRREERREDRQAFRPGVQFEPGQDAILMLAITVALEMMSD